MDEESLLMNRIRELQASLEQNALVLSHMRQLLARTEGMVKES